MSTKVVEIKTLKVGMPSDMSTDIGCLVSEEAAIEVERQVNETVAAGAKIVIGGKRNGAFYEPTIIDNITKFIVIIAMYLKLKNILAVLLLLIAINTATAAVQAPTKPAQQIQATQMVLE